MFWMNHILQCMSKLNACDILLATRETNKLIDFFKRSVLVFQHSPSTSCWQLPIPIVHPISNGNGDFCSNPYTIKIIDDSSKIQKIWIQDFLNQLKNVQKVENCRFFQHATFYFWNWMLQFLHLPKNHFCLIRSWTGKFMVDKLQFLWR